MDGDIKNIMDFESPNDSKSFQIIYITLVHFKSFFTPDTQSAQILKN